MACSFAATTAAGAGGMAGEDEDEGEFTRVEFDKVRHGVEQQFLRFSANEHCHAFQIELHILVIRVVKTHAKLQFAIGIFFGRNTQGQLGHATGWLLNSKVRAAPGICI